MIGTHDSYTFLPPTNPLFNLVSFLWRTQKKNIYEQKKTGVEYFDIRVRRVKDKWRVCHGIIDFNLEFDNIREILDSYSGYRVRFILERGDYLDKYFFIKEIWDNRNIETLSFACLKKNWEIILDRDLPIKDYTYIPWLSGESFWYNIKRFNFFSTIKRWAKKHNPIIDSTLIKGKTIIHFMDYV